MHHPFATVPVRTVGMMRRVGYAILVTVVTFEPSFGVDTSKAQKRKRRREIQRERERVHFGSRVVHPPRLSCSPSA